MVYFVKKSNTTATLAQEPKYSQFCVFSESNAALTTTHYTVIARRIKVKLHHCKVANVNKFPADGAFSDLHGGQHMLQPQVIALLP